MRKSIFSNGYFRAILAFILCGITLGSGAYAQSIAKVDLNELLQEVPAPPTSVSDAHSKATCARGNCTADPLFQTFDANVASAQKQWTAINAGQAAQIKTDTSMITGMRGYTGNNTTTTQKLEAAKSIPGMNLGALNFGQQMQDPAFKAKFNSMTPDQKVAYIQSAGVTAPAPAAAPAPTPDAAALALSTISDTATAQLKTVMPSYDTALNLFNDTTFIFGDSASMVRLQNAVTPSLDSIALIIDGIMTNADTLRTNAITAHQKQLNATIASKHLSSITDQQGFQTIQVQSLTNEIASENAMLPNFDKQWAHDKALLTKIISPYNKALISSGYGATLTTPADQSLITGIAHTQINAVSAIGHDEELIKHIYAEMATIADNLQSVQSQKVTPYKEN